MRRSLFVVVLVVIILLGFCTACDRVAIDLRPDAGGPSLAAIWDPRVCAGDPHARIELRVEDGAGAIVLGSTPCAEGAYELVVDHVGWYRASAIALDHAGRGRALASSTIAIDGPAVTWRVPW